MPKKRTLTQASEKRRGQQQAAKEDSSQRQRRLATLMSNSRQLRYQQQSSQVPSTSTVAPQQPVHSSQVPSTSTAAPQQPVHSSQVPSTSTAAPQQPVHSSQVPSTSTAAPQQPLQSPHVRQPVHSSQVPSTSTAAPQQPVHLPQQHEAPPEDPVRDNLDLIQEEINRKRAQERSPPSYCCAKLLRKDSEVSVHSVGSMDQVCLHCRAKLFRGAVLQGSSSICCHKGKIKLDEVVVCDELKNLIQANYDKTKNYLDHVRNYNNALAFASVQVNAVNLPGRGPFVFKIHGQIYHSVGPLNPPQGHAPSYAGLFFIDSEDALQHRVSHAANRQYDIEIMAMLQSMLERHNPYATLFHFLKDKATHASNMHTSNVVIKEVL